MAKGKKTKKKNWKLRRQLRKTFGCLFMISALIVTAIPVQPTEAKLNGNNGWTRDVTDFSSDWIYSDTANIPDVMANITSTDAPPVYYDEDQRYRFVYVDSNGKWDKTSSRIKSAVIVGFVRGVLPNEITFPANVDAYIRVMDTAGSDGANVYAAANKQGRPLYYKTLKNKTRNIDNTPVLSSQDLNGDGIINDYIYPETGEHAYSKTDDFVEPEAEKSISGRATADFGKFNACTPEMRATWEGMDLYYYDKDNGIPPSTAIINDGNPNWKIAYGDDVGRIADASVEFIGNYYVADGSDTLKKSSADASVFGGNRNVAATNITTLKFGLNDEGLSPLRGIGNYAFYGCAGLNSVKFGNGLATLGNYAFGNCTNLSSAMLVEPTDDGGTTGASLGTLGAGAFYNCALTSFVVPYSVAAIGDFCFKDCEELESITLTSTKPGFEDTGRGTSLEKIGYRAFENCKNLKSLTLPASYKGAEGDTNNGDLEGNVFHLSTVKGCEALEFIKTFDRNIRFVSDAPKSANDTSDPGDGYNNDNGSVDGNYSFAAFKNEVEGKEANFYFEGPGYISGTGGNKTPVHNVANVYHICFKYLGEDTYEIVENSYDTNDNQVGLVFQVGGGGNLKKFQVENPDGSIADNVRVPEIIMPEKVGKIGILSIEEGSFDHNCFIEKVQIAGTVTEIGPNAFKGSHNLKHIIFSNAANIQTLGKDAFATQVVDNNHGNNTIYPNTCKPDDFPDVNGDQFEDFKKADYIPFLSFTGAIETDDGKNTKPFEYAMKSTSNINDPTQRSTYITYYSGIPTNLTVRYNPDPEVAKAELIHFPTMKDLEEGFQVTRDEYGDGAYQPHGSSAYYRYPYMTDQLANELKEAANGNALSETMVNAINSVENIVIPTGVTGVKEGLFSGLNSDGKIIGGVKIPVTDADGREPDNPDWTPTYETKEDARPDETYSAPAKDIKTLTTKSITEIEPYTFGWMPELTKAYVSGSATIGNYAFDECPKLEYAEIGKETSALGLRPFSGCDKLAEVKFNENPSFTAESGVIYGIDSNGTKEKIVQCLPGRGKVVDSFNLGPDEFNGIKEIAPEAFMDCPEIDDVDLSTSIIKTIPEKCFARSDKLHTVKLPNTIETIQNESFWNTGLRQITIPDSIVSIANDAFARFEYLEDGSYGEEIERSEIDMYFNTPLDSNAAKYATLYSYIGVRENEDLRGSIEIPLMDAVDPSNPKQYDVKRVLKGDNLELTILDIPDHTAEGYRFSHWQPDPKDINPIVAPMPVWAMYEKIGANMYTVRFFDINKEEMKDYTQQVEEGKDAVPPSRDVMAVDGKVFTGWDRAYTEIKGNVDIYAQYSDRTEGMYYVTFYTDSDLKTVIGKTQEVKEGESAIEPAHPTKEGYTFSAWSSDGWKNVTKDWDIFAVYTQGGDGKPDDPDDPNKPDDPNNPDDPNKPGNSDGNDSNNDKDKDKDKDKDSVSENATKYKVTVNGGSGSGDYTAGTIVPINAYARADGTVFDKWTSSSNGVGFVNQTAISTTFTMPANNVEITANFKNDTSSVSSNSRSARRNSTTTVDVNKSGISNTGLASANVNGSSDNYVVRITDDAQATAAVIAALEGKYGNLNNIAYLPMDISLYDSTGQTKITDVSGISVDITLPLPDGLIQYAGNNRAASVVNGRLEDLATKFTTIDGVPCVQFTATHFSPYTIYVDKGNLTEGLIDATPKTGDPIHPKWFLAMGLACISIILFCKKDKKQPKVKAA